MPRHRRVRVTSKASIVFCLAAAALAGPAAGSTPTLMWTGVKRVNILCNVAGGPGIDHLRLAQQLCRDVERLARDGSPLPVTTIALGDPAVLASDNVTLLIHASVAVQKPNQLMAFSVRPYRTSTDQSSVLFGAPPRVAPLPTPTGPNAALDAALKASLAETLPWRSRQQDARPLIDRN